MVNTAVLMQIRGIELVPSIDENSQTLNDDKEITKCDFDVQISMAIGVDNALDDRKVSALESALLGFYSRSKIALISSFQWSNKSCYDC